MGKTRIFRLHHKPTPELMWLSAAIAMTVLPHTLHIPFWASILFFGLFSLRFILSNNSIIKYFVSTYFFRILIGGIIFAGVFTTFGTVVGRDAGVTLLVLLGGLKLLEVNSERDYFISTYIGFLLILTNFFYTQTLPTSIYMAIAVIILIAALVSFNDRDKTLNLQRRLRTASILFLQALPLMLLMFLLFPRISGPLWGIPKDALSGISGIDDEMSPGSISELILSDDIAFRVSFAENIPDKSTLYWRGPVLWYTDGYKWVPDRPKDSDTEIITRSDPVNYTVTLEPTDKNWLFSLDVPREAPNDSYLGHDMQLRTRKPVVRRIRYEMTSYPQYALLSNNQEDLDNALQLPGNYHPKTIALARSWRQQGLDDMEIVQKALTLFNEESYYYTLIPPLFIDDSIDEFMFESKQGFCEHYAAAFTVLMRAAGIPTRVVTGYQGGTVNPVGQYLIVHQRDAHAWTEVWLGKDRGWVRIDPTSAVSPSRVTDGIESAIPDSLIRVPLGFYNNSFTRQIWERMSNTFDAINNRWNQWVLGYDRNRQRLLLSRLGLDLNRRELMVGMIIVISICMIIIGYGLFNQSRVSTDNARKYYNKFRKKLSKKGIPIFDHEGPQALAHRAGRIRADLADRIDQITETYIQIRYQNNLLKTKQLISQIALFKPKNPELINFVAKFLHIT
jgi:transglutaminase-like putative cysteine protease